MDDPHEELQQIAQAKSDRRAVPRLLSRRAGEVQARNATTRMEKVTPQSEEARLRQRRFAEAAAAGPPVSARSPTPEGTTFRAAQGLTKAQAGQRGVPRDDAARCAEPAPEADGRCAHDLHARASWRTCGCNSARSSNCRALKAGDHRSASLRRSTTERSSKASSTPSEHEAADANKEASSRPTAAASATSTSWPDLGHRQMHRQAMMMNAATKPADEGAGQHQDPYRVQSITSSPKPRTAGPIQRGRAMAPTRRSSTRTLPAMSCTPASSTASPIQSRRAMAAA